jgi:hypothetical protein
VPSSRESPYGPATVPSTRTGLEVDGTPSVPWSRAKQFYDEMTAATESNDRMNRERLEKQLAAEQARGACL